MCKTENSSNADPGLGKVSKPPRFIIYILLWSTCLAKRDAGLRYALLSFNNFSWRRNTITGHKFEWSRCLTRHFLDDFGHCTARDCTQKTFIEPDFRQQFVGYKRITPCKVRKHGRNLPQNIFHMNCFLSYRTYFRVWDYKSLYGSDKYGTYEAVCSRPSSWSMHSNVNCFLA